MNSDIVGNNKPATAGARRFRLQGFKLEEHPRTLIVVVLFALFAGYVLVDIIFTAKEGYVSTPPYWLFIASGIAFGILCYLWMYRGAVPRMESLGLAAITAIAFACALYPGLLRIGSFAGTEHYKPYTYNLAANLTLHPVDGSLPTFAAPLDREYWRDQRTGAQWNIEMRKSVLGLWVYRVKPLRDEIDIYNTRKAFASGLSQGGNRHNDKK